MLSRVLQILFLALSFFPSDAVFAYHIPTPFLEAVRKEAIEALEKAYVVRPRQIYLDLMIALYNAQLVVVDMRTARTLPAMECLQDNFGGFVISKTPNIIYTCPDLHEAFQVHGPSTYVPHFIHEAVHTLGILDECEATKIQVSASMDAGIIQPLISPKYLKECKLNLRFRL
ncbi:MAG: hypothetical protein AB7H97_11120 [Pseudobdellovibrionaceae bacterium]